MDESLLKYFENIHVETLSLMLNVVSLALRSHHVWTISMWGRRLKGNQHGRGVESGKGEEKEERRREETVRSRQSPENQQRRLGRKSQGQQGEWGRENQGTTLFQGKAKRGPGVQNCSTAMR